MELIRVHTAQHCDQCGVATLNRIHTAHGAVCGRCFGNPPKAPVVSISEPLQKAWRDLADDRPSTLSRFCRAMNPFRRGGVVR